jgi:hypothetical protein
MHDIQMHETSDDFARCWQAAGLHLQGRVQDGLSWLKADLAPPFLEHLSFRLGNQLFYIRLEENEGGLAVPGNRGGLLTIADGCQGHACLMPMRRRGTMWEPVLPGWGLMDLRTGRPLDPLTLVTNERIEMTDWEVHDFAVQVVRDQLRGDGVEIMSTQGNPAVEPSLWFKGEDGPEWVVVRTYRYPAPPPPRPANWSAIAAGCARLSPRGHYITIGVANADDPSQPLWRGHGISVSADETEA